MELETFQILSTTEVAALVRANGPKVCVFPINGTRRWFYLEHAAKIEGDLIQAYMDISSQNHVDLYRLFFDHGLDTLLTPEFGTDLLLRGDEYMQRIGADGLARLASHPIFVEFYEAYDVRVHFYGEYRRQLAATPYASLIDLFEAVSVKTSQHAQHRLFIGVFGADASQTVSEFSIEYFKQNGQAPEKEELIHMYYGETVKPVDLFIGFDKFSAFDYPLLASGAEDLYFTVAPSPYMSQIQLRTILYDHLYTRRTPEMDYQAIRPEDLEWLRAFYLQNNNSVLGTGIIKAGVWLPISQLTLPR